MIDLKSLFKKLVSLIRSRLDLLVAGKTAGLILVSIVYSSAQNFAPIGAEWHFEKRFAFRGDVDYVKIICNDTILINGKLCQRLEKINNIICNNRPDVEYVFSNGDSVFLYDWRLKDFGLMYVFNADLNESWTIKFMGANQILDSINVYVDSISTMNINGHALRALHVTYSQNVNNYEYTSQSTILEKIGDLIYMFNWNANGELICDGDYPTGINCYSDSQIGFFNWNPMQDCDHVTVSSKESMISPVKMMFREEDDQLVVHSQEENFMHLHITNSQGQFLYKSSGFGVQHQVDISHFVSGIYFVQVHDNNKVILSKSFVKR